MSIDYVFPFVNPYDPEWKKQYSKISSDNAAYNGRFRKSPRLMRFMLRSVAKNMPWIDKMFMVVSSLSQVPSWISRDTVNIVLHEDIIPQDELPTFNVCTIDKYINSIPQMSSSYVYGHDDYYAISPVEQSQMFIDGKPAAIQNSFGVKRCKSDEELDEFVKRLIWFSICNNSYRAVIDAYGMNLFKDFIKEVNELCVPLYTHMPMPHDKDDARQVFDKCQISSIKFGVRREPTDIMPLRIADSLHNSCIGPRSNSLKSAIIPNYNSPNHVMLDEITQSAFNRYIDSVVKNANFLCINENTDVTRPMFAEWLETKFPDKCKYEI